MNGIVEGECLNKKVDLEKVEEYQSGCRVIGRKRIVS